MGIAPRRNPRILEAALDLLAALVKGQADLASIMRSWKVDPAQEPKVTGFKGEEDISIPGFLGDLVDMMSSGSTGVRIAAASW